MSEKKDLKKPQHVIVKLIAEMDGPNHVPLTAQPKSNPCPIPSDPRMPPTKITTAGTEAGVASVGTADPRMPPTKIVKK